MGSPRVVFVNSMSDLFHEEIPPDLVAHVFEIMVQASTTFPGVDQARSAPCRLAPDFLGGNVWMASRSRIAASSIEQIAYVRCRPASGSSLRSRCWDRWRA